MSTLSIFDAAREAPDAIAVVDGQERLSFRQLALRALPRAQALVRARPAALALTPRADVESLLWLYAALATGTPLLTLHQRATDAERHRALTRLAAAELPELDARVVLDPNALRPVAASETLAFIPTSGSTGTPRLVQLSRAALQASARASAANLGWQQADQWLLCLPLSHTGGLSIVIRTLLSRTTVQLFEPGEGSVLSNPEQLARAAQAATLLSLVPTLLERLLDVGFESRPQLRAVLLGGSGCSPALARRAHAARLPLLTSYGLTETASQVVTRRYAERYEALPERDGCVSSGHPLPGVELRLSAGKIAIRGPSLLSGYVADETPQLDAEGFFHTSDRGELGETGELYVRGRLDDVIITAGENVDPLEVEAALLELPGVRAACVFGTPSPRFGQIVTAALVTHDASLAEPARLALLLANRLARHKLPRRALCVESLPVTASGKPDRSACAERFGAAFAEHPHG